MKISKRVLRTIALTSLIVPLYATIVLAHCFLGGTISFGTTFAAGPNVYWGILQGPNAEAILGAIRAGRDAWDVTNSKDYIGDWNGILTPSDCPSVTYQTQLGAWNFESESDPNYYCQTLVSAINQEGVNRETTIAFVDYSDFPECPYPQCGTKSILVNLKFAFSTNPAKGQVDIQSIAAHEFGHVLGLGHAYQGVCDAANPPCSANPFQETMSPISWYDGEAETCRRDLATHDVEDANALYSNGGGTSDWSPSSR